MMKFRPGTSTRGLANGEIAARLVIGAGWTRLLEPDLPATHAYVVAETSALVQRRLGMAAVERLHRGLLPVVGVTIVDRSTHATGH